MKQDTFTTATKLYKQKKYSDVISFLEPQIPFYRGSFRFFYLLGMSCLYSNLWDFARGYLKSAYYINDRNLNVSLAYGFVLLRVGKRQEGINILLALVGDEEFKGVPEWKKAMRLLNLLRNTGADKDLIEILDKSHRSAFLPGGGINWKIPLYILLGATVSLGCGLVFLFIDWDSETSRENISAILIDDSGVTDFSSTDFIYMLSEKEITSSFNRAKKFLNQFQDNFARREVNRLLNSNASVDIKQKSLVLSKYIKDPDMKNFYDSFSFEEVNLDPLLYQRCYVKWKGRLSDLKILKNQIQFNFLVGYQDKKIVEGIVPASLDFEYLLDEEYAYELLALVFPTSNLEVEDGNFLGERSFMLKVLAIRRIQ